jgi:hypothetical protein
MRESTSRAAVTFAANLSAEGDYPMLAFSDLQTDENAFVIDGLNDAPGLMDFEILEDPRQPRVRALKVETAGGSTFTLAFDARVAMALATALVSAALAIDPTLKENFVEHINKSEA